MARGLKIDTNEMVKVLIVGLVFLYLINSIIDFSAISSTDPDATIFRSGVDYSLIVPTAFTWIIVGMAVWLAWVMVTNAQGTFTKKYMVTLIVIGFLLYFLYNNVLVNSGLLPDLKPIEFSAYQLQSVVGQ